jgi:hypothetical protein
MRPISAEERAAADEATKAAEPQKKDTSTKKCVDEFAKLWRHSEAGKSSAKTIQASWKLAQIADMAGATDDDREAFLVEVGEAMAKVEEAKP